MRKIHTKCLQNFETEITNGKHTLLADEPHKLGGNDAGLTPRELLHASLASCSAITMRMYGNRKGWELGGIYVDIEKVLGEDDQTSLLKKISFDAELDQKQKERLKTIASKCPVHKLLTEVIDIETEIV